jgi:hypothetical protein
MSLAPLGHFPGQPAGFNHAAAEAVFDYISKCDDDTAEVLADMVIGGAYQHDLLEYAPVISKMLGEHLVEHGDELRERLTRTYIAKRANGEDVTPEMAAAELIGKAFGGPDYSPQARAQRAREEHRDLITGRFVQSHHPLVFETHDEHGKPLQAAHDGQAARQGIPEPGQRLTAAQKLRYQQAYKQIQGMITGFQHHPEGAYLHLHYGTGTEIEDMPGRGQDIPIKPGKTLHAVSISRVPEHHEDLSPFETLRDLGGALGHNYGLDTDANGVNPGVQRIRDFDATRSAGDPFRPSSNLMIRLGAGSRALDESFRNEDGTSVLPRRVQAALKAGQVVGTYGPEAQKVIGPAADRAAYRYRGTERATPDRRLGAAMESIRRNPNLRTDVERRELMVHGVETDAGWHPSGVLSYFRSRLPKADLNTLQRKSGKIPPSEGVIINRQGKVAVQAVGFGDDHYLPFNLKHLKGLRGGEYIRTRTYGGPTTEDVYTGLISGAKSVTVVSHNGVYTVEFDPSFKGSRRYNDKAAQMVGRYGQLLDAVKNGEITTGQIDPTRMAEIDEAAASSYDPDSEPEAYATERLRLLAREKRNPTFSEAQKAQAASAFLDSQAAKHRTPDGHEMTGTELIDDWVSRESLKQADAYRKLQVADAGADFRIRGSGRPAGMSGQGVAPGMTAADFKRSVAARAGLTDDNPDRVASAAIQAMGLNEQFGRYLEREEATYKASLKPLALNGPGYKMALDALQEQFPYYVKGVDFHPWHDARNAVDTGYVKPKHNRPAGVLAGYFDDTINGQSKVHADTIRGQGHAKEVRLYQSPQARVVARARAATTGGTGLTAGRGTPLNADAARELRLQADTGLLAAIRARTHFGGGLHDPDGKWNLAAGRGNAVADHGDDIRRMSPDLHDVLFKPSHELDALQGTPRGAEELHEKLSRAVAAIEKYKVFDVDADALRRFRDEGKDRVAGKYDAAQVGTNLRSINDKTDHDFGQRVLDKAHHADSDSVARAYGNDPKVKALPGLSDAADLGDDESFRVNAERVAGELKARHNAVLRWQAEGANPMHRPKGADTLPRDVEGLVRAHQYKRRHKEAVARETPEPEAGPEGDGSFGFGGGAPQFNIHIHQGGPGGAATATTSAGGTFTPVGDPNLHSKFDSIIGGF